MEQLTQKLKNGTMQVLEVPPPALLPGTLLIRNHYSLVSAGTEGSTVKTARMGFIGKAKARPQQLKQVLQILKSQGPVQTYRAVMKRLDVYSPLGYSCAGEVIDLAPDAAGFHAGDLVACGGLTACHAELVSVPLNLCMKLKPGVDLKQAAYNTLGAIALQGIRQADLRLGETCAVIGLGLLGQLTCILLKASGIRVAGIDVDQAMVKLAGSNGADLPIRRDSAGIEAAIMEFTNGFGCDAVIITAATDSLDPINFAGTIARKRGTIVVVGNVPTGFSREPDYYKKELQVRMSCSYGPGRYDPTYEEKGLDYPYAYVRWTENRNMQAFQELIHAKKIDVSRLTTHVFPLEEAPSAYEIILKKAEPFLGILIEYSQPAHRDPVRNKIEVLSPNVSHKSGAINIGFIGAGSYAQGQLLPNIPREGWIVRKGILTASGTSSRSVAERFGFEFCTGDLKDLLAVEEINTVFVATRHDSHAELTLEALQAGKHIFIEKPLCLKPEELETIKEAYAGLQSSKPGKVPVLMVGYNRRFSPFVQEMKKQFGQGPLAATYRVNAGTIPPDSWMQDPEVGGGRIIGEVCHFVDTLNYLVESHPVSVFASSLPDPHYLHDTLQVCLKYADGSVGTIAYLANGDKSLPKERLEVFGHGMAAVLDDFRVLTIYAGRKKTKRNLLSQDKGQKNEISRFLECIRDGGEPPIAFGDLHTTSLVTFKILESIRKGESVRL